jgi:CD109 antigen
LDYLNATNSLSNTKKEQGISALTTGVQQMLEFRITTGSHKGAFSIWNRYGRGESDSIWLTAYIAKNLGKAKHWISVHDKNIFEALTFLRKQQNDKGSFKEYGPISYYNLQTDSSKGIALTSYVTIAFLENKDYKNEFVDVINNALDYIDNNYAELNDNYALAIAAYAQALAGRNTVNILKTLFENAHTDHASFMFWEKESNGTLGSTSPATKNEIAAYMILALVQSKRSIEALPIVKWLITQRNSGGGFASSHDTVIAIQALVEIAEQLYTAELDMKIKVDVKNDEKVVFLLTKANHTQKRKMSPISREFSLSATGKGIASFQSYLTYVDKSVDLNKIYNLDYYEIHNGENKNLLQLKVCASVADETAEVIGMSIIEVQLPSGYVSDSSYDLLSQSSVRVRI